MLELVDQGVLTIERLVELMAHNPARLFGVCQRGFLRQGYRADITIVRPNSPWTVTNDCILSKCGWSPLEGTALQWQVLRTGADFKLRCLGCGHEVMGPRSKFEKSIRQVQR